MKHPRIEPGQRFERLEVLRFLGLRHRDGYWECRCDCGARTQTAARHLKAGVTRSCGCLTKDVVVARSYKHGNKTRARTTPEYDAWCNAKARCYDTNHPRYPDWGGRGIAMCERWRNDFAAFLFDMGPRPVGHQLDRIDNDGPYAPENCRWATKKQQRHNRRPPRGWHGRVLEFNGEAHSWAEWSRRTGIALGTLMNRIKHGWTPEATLTTKPHHLLY